MIFQREKAYFSIAFALLLIICCSIKGGSSSSSSHESILGNHYVSSVKNYSHTIEENHNHMRKKHEIRSTIPFTVDEMKTLIDLMPNVTNYTECHESEQCAKNWFVDYNRVLSKLYELRAFLEFQYSTNITDFNGRQIELTRPISNRFQLQTKPVIKAFLKNSNTWDASLKRMLYLSSQGLLFNDQEAIKIDQDLNKMKKIYANAKVCDTKDAEKCYGLEPDLVDIMGKSRNYSRLLWAWRGWHDATGPNMKSPFKEVVKLGNKAAKENNYKDLSEQWIEDFEEKRFEQIMDDLFIKIKPVYQLLHAYVRAKLNDYYKGSLNSSSNTESLKHNPKLIQAHLVGNMWAQSWENIFDIVKPYPSAKEINLDALMKTKNYTVHEIVKQAEKFFVSMGLFKMNPTFWNKSMFEKPANRSAQCHATAMNFFNGYDFRIKMCASVNKNSYHTIHHEMGHIEYYIAYRNHSVVFKDGANSAFHEAVGDTIGMSAVTAKHLKTMGLIDTDETDYQQDINFLMKMALKKIAFLPYSYLVDKWRWSVFRGYIDDTNYNTKWWQMRHDYQGIESPIRRSENDFDPGAKYHTVTFTPYARYFIGYFQQFQFYKALCNLSGHKGNLFKCDFYNSTVAGAKLKEMLALGASRHWTYALYVLTGEKKISADPIFEYFKPLIEWLKKELKSLNQKPGW